MAHKKKTKGRKKNRTTVLPVVYKKEKPKVNVIVSATMSPILLLHAIRDFIMCLLEMAIEKLNPRNVDCMH